MTHMRHARPRILLLTGFFIICTFLPHYELDAQEHTFEGLRINEILPNPVGKDAENEFIEIINTTDNTVSLSGITLSDRTEKNVYTFSQEVALEPQDLLTLFHSNDFNFTLNNNGDDLFLRTPDNTTIDTFTYTTAQEGESLNRGNTPYSAKPTPNEKNQLNPNLKNPTKEKEEVTNDISEDTPKEEETTNPKNNINDDNIQEKKEVPENQNTQEKPEKENVQDKTIYQKILISEILVNPYGKDTAGEFIELYNPHKTDITLENWKLQDTSKNGSYTFTDKTIKAESYYTIFRSEFGFALNNTGEEKVILKNPEDTISAEATFTAPAEGMSLNFSKAAWLPSITITPNAINNVTQALECRQTEEKDHTNNEHVEMEKSIDENTDTNQNTVSQGNAANKNNDDALPSILISEFLPNPEGADSENEFIELFNPSTQEVNLIGWTLSDTSKGGKYTFDKEKAIKSKGFVIIYRKEFTFALNNTGEEKITLTKPGGKISDETVYSETAQGNSYIKEGGIWKQTEKPTPGEENILHIAEIPNKNEESIKEEGKESEKVNENENTDQQSISEESFPTLSITEFLPNPEGEDALQEFIEIYNPQQEAVNLKNWTLKDNSKSGAYTFNDRTLQPGEYTAIYRSTSKIALNNTGEERIFLLTPTEKVVAQAVYSASQEGISYAFSKEKWQETTTPTPGAANIISAPIVEEEAAATEEKSKIQTEEKPETTILKNYPNIFLTEFLPQPNKEKNEVEFIELYNPTAEDHNLSQWIIKDASKNGSYTLPEKSIIKARSFFLIEKPAFTFALNNTGNEVITLIAPNSNTKDEAAYTGSTKGFSYARKILSPDEKFVPTSTPTPGKENNITNTGTEVTETKDENSGPFLPLILTELLPAPESGKEEYIEIYNPNNEEVALEGWELSDASVRGIYTFKASGTIDPGAYHTIYKSTYKFALNNSGAETVTLKDPSGKETSTVSYDGAQTNASYSRENIWESEKWRFTLTQTPGKPNIFPDPLLITEIEVDGKYKDADTEFSLEIVGADMDDVSVKWDFGNGKTSTKKKATHKYKKTGNYTASVTVKNAVESITKTFPIEIKKYPERKIRIEAVLPNPTGKDSGKEYILITNKDKKKVNLDDWSIATGKDEDSLKNHPFKKKITLKKGESKKITRKHSAISLGNSEGTIELRSPSGKEIDSVSYDYTDAKTIPEDALYIKGESGWTWQNTIKSENSNKSTFNALSKEQQEEIIAQALANTKENEKEDAVITHSKKAQEILHENEQVTNKKSLWQKIVDRIKSVFTSDAQAKQKTTKEIPRHFTDDVCTKKLHTENTITQKLCQNH